MLAVGGTRFAVYNRAGNELTVCSRTRTLYSQNFDSGILLCAMSNNNSLAVVTESGRYAAQVRIYDPSMRQTYSWEMTQSDGTPIAVDFAPDSRKFAARDAGRPRGPVELFGLFYEHRRRHRRSGLHGPAGKYAAAAGLAEREPRHGGV